MRPEGGLMSRWVCLRCYESNDESSAACTKCGLIRGATPAEGDTSWQPATSPSGRRMSPILSLVLRFWWIIAIAIVAVGGFIFNAQRDDQGQITQGGNLQVSDLRVGDCFSLKDEDEEVTEEVDARPCTEAHAYELYYAIKMPDGSYPSDDGFTTYIGQTCLPAFDAYVGLAYEDSQYDFVWFQPTPDGWQQGDRGVSCALYDPSSAQLTSVIRNSGR